MLKAKNITTYLVSATPIWLFTMTLLRSSDEGVFTYETANVKGEIEPQVPPQKYQILAVFRAWRSGVRESFDFYCKRHIYTWIHVV